MLFKRLFSFLFLFLFFSIWTTAQGSPCPSSCACSPKLKRIKCNDLPSRVTQFPLVFNNDTKRLILEKGGIENITKDDFKNLTQLTYFMMTEGRLKFIEEGAFQLLKNLESIDLSSNLLKILPRGAFANLTKLKVVVLNNNTIQSLPEDIFNNSPMVELLSMTNTQLDSTALASIGKGRLALKSLTTLDLNGTPLHSLAKEQFSGLPNLTELTAINCKIQYIHTDFLNGTKVTYVDLLKNPIVKIDANAMRGDQVVDFSCRYCGLTSEKVFGNESFFLQMTSLNRLDLVGNKINHVPKDAFKGMSSLRRLLLSNNNITSIEENPFISLSSDLDIGIDNNPFNCDCNLAWFHKYALETFDKEFLEDIEDLTCASPSKLMDKSFKDLNTSQFCCDATVNTPIPGSMSMYRVDQILIFLFIAILLMI